MALSKVQLEGLFSTGDGKWRTPVEWFNRLDAIFHFDLDAAADKYDRLCERYIATDYGFYGESHDLEQMDALASAPWPAARSIWLNPPFGRGLFDWMVKVIKEANRRPYPLIAVLIPVRTETSWSQLIRAHSKFIVFFNERIKYVHPDITRSQKSPGFPSMLCVVHKQQDHPLNKSWYEQLQEYGDVWPRGFKSVGL